MSLSLPTLEEDVLYRIFRGSPVRDLAEIEKTCSQYRRYLNSEVAAEFWAGDFATFARRRRFLLPVVELKRLPVHELKKMIRIMRRVQGPLNGPARLTTADEVRAVVEACFAEEAAEKTRGYGSRLVVGRLYFHEETLEDLRLSSDEDMYCFSSEFQFRWPGCVRTLQVGASLSASLGLRPGTFVLEVGGGRENSHLDIDVHLVDPRLPERTVLADVQVEVNASCDPLPVPAAIDIGAADAWRVLASPEGVLCVFATRGASEVEAGVDLRSTTPSVDLRGTDTWRVLASSEGRLCLLGGRGEEERDALRGAVRHQQGNGPSRSSADGALPPSGATTLNALALNALPVGVRSTLLVQPSLDMPMRH